MKIVGYYVKDNKIHEVNIDVDKAIVKAGTISIAVIGGLSGEIVHAQSISKGLQPLIDILKDLAEPISYGFMIKGFLKIMAGEENEGLKTIKGAIGGYIGIQWIPMIFRIIKGIKF